MQVILYLPILVLSVVSAFVVFSKVKMLFLGSNMLDLGLGIIGAWFFIFFVCVDLDSNFRLFRNPDPDHWGYSFGCLFCA